MIGGVYNVGACYCVTVPASYPSTENQGCDIVTGHTVTVSKEKIHKFKLNVWF